MWSVCRGFLGLWDAQDVPILFPMHTVATDVLLKMTRLEAHETLKAGTKSNVGALTIRIGFGGILYYNYNQEPPKPHGVLGQDASVCERGSNRAFLVSPYIENRFCSSPFAVV